MKINTTITRVKYGDTITTQAVFWTNGTVDKNEFLLNMLNSEENTLCHELALRVCSDDSVFYGWCYVDGDERVFRGKWDSTMIGNSATEITYLAVDLL